MERTKILKFSLLVITLLVVWTSFNLSGQSDVESLKRSDWVLETLKISTHQEIIDHSGSYSFDSSLIRETAHVILYVAIALPLFLLSYASTKRIWVSAVITYLLVMGYALFDEMHQETIHGRGYEWLDLVLDFVGCTITVTISSVSLMIGRIFGRSG